MNYTIATNDHLRELCIKENWFTCGSCEKYDKLFYANRNGATVTQLATIIWVCSDSVDYHEIHQKLRDLHDWYENITKTIEC